MAVRKIRNSWGVDIRADYVRYRKRSPENTKAGAEAYEAVLRHRLAQGEPIDRPKDITHPLFEEFAWQWFNEYVVPNNKYSEQRNKKHILRASLVPFFSKASIDQINAQGIE